MYEADNAKREREIKSKVRRSSLQPLPVVGSTGKGDNAGKNDATSVALNITPAAFIVNHKFSQLKWLLTFKTLPDTIHRIGRWTKYPGKEKLNPAWRDVHVNRFDFTGYENIFCAMNRRKGVRGSQGTDKDVKAISHVTIDIEYGTEHDKPTPEYERDNAQTCREKVNAVLKQNGIPYPTYYVHSGHGWHISWLYDAAYPATENNLLLQNDIYESLRHLLHGDMNYRWTMAFRVPGTINHKKDKEPVSVTLDMQAIGDYIKRDELLSRLKESGKYIDTQAAQDMAANQAKQKDAEGKNKKKVTVSLDVDGKKISFEIDKRQGKSQRTITGAAKRLDVLCQNLLSGYIQELVPQSNGYRGYCPICKKAIPERSGKAFVLGVEDDTLLYYCHRCRKGGDIIDLLCKLEGVTVPGARNMIAAAFGEDAEPTDAEKLLQALKEKNIEPLGYSFDEGLTFYLLRDGVHIQELKEHEIRGAFLSVLLGGDERVPARKPDKVFAQIFHDRTEYKKRLTQAAGSLQYIDGRWIAIDNTGFYDVADSFTRLDDKVMACMYPGGEKWIDAEYLKMTTDIHLTIREIHTRLKAIIKQWHWQCSDTQIDVLAALVMLSPFQSQMTPWRPWIYIGGKSKAGKTHFVKYFLSELWRGISTVLEKPTYFAFIKETSCAPVTILDEFETTDKRHVPQIINALKAANTGARIVRGRADQKTNVYRMKVMPWIACIYNPIKEGDSAALTRMLRFELERPREGDNLSLPNEEALRALQHGSLYAMAQNWPEIQRKALAYTHNDKRTLDNLRYAMAILEIVFKTYDLQSVITAFQDTGTDYQSDDEHLLSSILDATVRHESQAGIARTRTIRGLICDTIEQGKDEEGIYKQAEPMLEQGIICQAKYDQDTNKWYLAIYPKWSERLLRDERDSIWHGARFSGVLSRIPGAQYKNIRCADGRRRKGRTRRCVLIPIDGTIDVVKDLWDTLKDNLGLMSTIDTTPATRQEGIGGNQDSTQFLLDALQETF